MLASCNPRVSKADYSAVASYILLSYNDSLLPPSKYLFEKVTSLGYGFFKNVCHEEF